METMNVDLNIFLDYESQVRSYCRAFPTVFTKAKGSVLTDHEGKEYLDFLSGAGSLNYGHNNANIKQSVIDYLKDDGIVLSLDMHSTAKKEFIQTFQNIILEPRGLDYRFQFTSPTGTSVVESAIKLARKHTNRENVIAFTNAYHGMSGVSLSLTGNRGNRQAISYSNVTRFPYDNYLGAGIDEVAYYRKLFEDNSSGVDLPAAIILETVQGEGGINVARNQWLVDVSELAKEIGALLIIDDVQAGCGRTGKFFSFERAGITPDIVCLSKSISGIGFPMALMLLKRELDIWAPGEDNGTFRGNNIAFVAAKKTIETYWGNNQLEEETSKRAEAIDQFSMDVFKNYPEEIIDVRGIGLMRGIEFRDPSLCEKISSRCFEYGLIIERAGEKDQVLKFMPALTINAEQLERGLNIVDKAIKECISQDKSSQANADITVA